VRVQTFYSYKGGVGRSLLLANYAHFLSRSGQKVVVVDLDLEAPGLHFKFGVAEAVRGGVVDFAARLLDRTSTPPSVDEYLVPVTTPHTGADGVGSIELLPAGRAPSIEYNDLLFQVLASQFAPRGMTMGRILGRLIEAVRNERPDAKFILIDSRTGITETGRLALGDVSPDTVICVLLCNDENRTGAGGVIRGLLAQGVTVVPVLARLPMLPYQQEQRLIESERALVLGRWRDDSSERLKPFQVLHADLQLPIEERLLWPSQLTLLDSALLYDYVQLFRVLEPDIFKSSPYRHLVDVFPRRKQLDEWNVWTLVDGGEGKLLRTSIEERIRRRNAGAPKAGKQPPRFNYVPSFFIPTAQCFQKLGRTIADKLAFRTLGIETGSAIATKTESEINFDLLAMQMREGIFDFCGEGYFLSGARAQFAAVVQFGWLHTFECVVRRETSVWRTLQAYRSSSNVAPVLAALFKGDAANTIEIGLLGESAATSEVAPHVTSYVQGDRLTMEPNHQQLAKWLVDAPKGKQRLVICDHGVAARMREVIERTYGRRGEYNESAECPRLQYSENTVAAPRGIPVGYLYPREDASWRRQISLAFAESIDAMGQSDWAMVQDELLSVHVEPFTYEEVRSYLLMDMTIDEALSRERRHHQTVATPT
jgi:Mrp family chromosome partitioning ATPase